MTIILLVSSLCGIVAFGTAAIGFLWSKHRGVTRQWIQAELRSYLRNDDTPIAVYQHETRDEVRGLREDFGELREDFREMRQIIINHVTDRNAHGGS